MSNYAYVVSANERYLTNLNILLNSLEKVKNIQDVHIVSWDLPKDYLDKLSQLSYKAVVHEISDIPEMIEISEGEALMRYRYEVASQLTEYDSVCVLDADTMICRNLDIWHEISYKAEVIVGCILEQKRWYGEPEEHHKVNGEYPIPRTWAEKDICCSPIFFNPKKFGDAFHWTWSIIADYDFEHRFKGPDMDSLNISLIKFGYTDRIIALAEATWSGLHETLLKPFSHISEMHDQLWTINGEEIWLIHGQYLNPIWRGWQIDGQIGCVNRELDGSPRNKQIAEQCLDFITKKFEEINKYKIKIII
jgi:hypothetical protein